jgi:hypothetical protein
LGEWKAFSWVPIKEIEAMKAMDRGKSDLGFEWLSPGSLNMKAYKSVSITPFSIIS